MKIKTGNILLLITLLYYVLIFFSDILDTGNVLIIVSMVLFLAYNMFTNNGKLRFTITSLHYYILFFALFILASSTWATSRNLTIPKFNALLFILLGMIVVTMDNNSKEAHNRLINCLLYGNYLVVYICIITFGWNNIIRMIADQDRVSTIAINVNSLGMCAAYAIVINFHKIISIKHRLDLSDCLMVPAAVALIASGSRKAIIIVFSGILGLLFLKNATRFFSIFLKVVISIPIIILIIYGLSKIDMFNSLFERMMDVVNVFSESATRYNNTVWLRVAYINLGLELFTAHPLLGVGIGNSNYYALQYYGKNQYFHNNFVELLACGGIVGFLIYYSMYFWLFYTMIKYREHRDELYDICLVLLFIHFFIGLGLNQYFSKNTYFVLLVIWIEARHLKQMARQKQETLFE